MKLKNILLSMLILCNTGCVTIIKWKYGITNPKEQTPGKLMSFLEKHHYPASGQFVFNDSLSYFYGIRNPVFRKHLPGHMIFDRNGLLLQRDTTQCQWSGYEVIKVLSPDSAYPTFNELQLEEILGRIHPLGTDPLPDATLQQPDFTVVVTWAKFLGTYNARLFELAEAARQNKTAGIRLIWLNIDMQESWNLTEGQKMEIR